MMRESLPKKNDQTRLIPFMTVKGPQDVHIGYDWVDVHGEVVDYNPSLLVESNGQMAVDKQGQKIFKKESPQTLYDFRLAKSTEEFEELLTQRKADLKREYSLQDEDFITNQIKEDLRKLVTSHLEMDKKFQNLEALEAAHLFMRWLESPLKPTKKELSWQDLFKSPKQVDYIQSLISEHLSIDGAWIPKPKGKYLAALYRELEYKGYFKNHFDLSGSVIANIINKQFKTQLGRRNFQPLELEAAEAHREYFKHIPFYKG
jgi:hypothetical protein